VSYTTNYSPTTLVGATGLSLSPNISMVTTANYNITAYPGIITVVDLVPTITYTNTSYVLTKNTAIQPIVPNVTGTNLSFTAPLLPAGLSLNALTGAITGTPLVTNTNASNYTVTVINTAGQSSIRLSIVVLPDQPQGSIGLKDRAIMSTDSVTLQFNFTQGIAPYNAIVLNTVQNTYDTLLNLRNGQYVKLKPTNQSTMYRLVQLSDANNTYRTNAFDNDTASLQILVPQMDILLSANKPTMLPDSSYKLQLSLQLKNNGEVNLKDLQINADLSKLIAAGYQFTIDSVVVKSGTLPVNPNYSGLGNANTINGIIAKGANKNQYIKSMSVLLGNYLLNNNANLAIGEEALIQINLSIAKTGNNVPLFLQFSYAGLASLTLTNNEFSTQVVGAMSIDAKPNAIVLDTVRVPTLISLQPKSYLASSLNVSAGVVVPQGYEFHFTGKLVNLGTTNLDSIQVIHSLNNAFVFPDSAFLKAPPTIQRGNIVYNSRYNGYSNDTLFDHSGSIAYGDSIQFEYDVVVRSNKTRATWLNNLLVKGLSTLDRTAVQDSSVAGLLADPNRDGLPYEQSYTRASINFVAPSAPVVANAVYQYHSTIPANIKSLVKSYPIGAVPVWCNLVTTQCDTIAPSTPTAIGNYIYEVRSYDTLSLLYSATATLDTIIVKPVKPNVVNTKYIIGLASNPQSIQGQVTGMTGSTIKYKIGSNSYTNAPLINGFTKGNTNIAVSQVVNAIESDTSMLSITMLDVNDLVHVQKLASQPKLTSNSNFDIEYKFILSNLFDQRIDNIVLSDVLRDQFPSGIEFSVQSLEVNSVNLHSNGLYNGNAIVNITDATSYLNPLQVDSIKLRVNIKPNGYNGLISNQASLIGHSVYGDLTMLSSAQTKLQESAKLATDVNISTIGVKVPGGFSPNNDGIDDKWIIVRPFGTTISVKVFNRWGAEIYSELDYQNTWDGRGTSSFLGEIVPEGTYFYIVEVRDINGSLHKLTGALTIVK
jgi:gliding motility-associated-like protein